MLRPITAILQRFILPPDAKEMARTAAKVVENCTGKTVAPELFEYKNNTIWFTGAPIVRSEIFLQQEKITNELRKATNGKISRLL